MGIILPVQTIQNFFCDKSARAYAGGGEYEQSESGAGERSFTDIEHFPEIGAWLRFRDTYVQGGPFSYGTTDVAIHIGDATHKAIMGAKTFWKQIWAMQYRGQEHEGWNDNAEDFLKEALRKTYEKREFIGGRGTSLFSCPIGKKYWTYRNFYRGDFIAFDGKEDISVAGVAGEDGGCVFRYSFDGLLLAGTHTLDGQLVIDV